MEHSKKPRLELSSDSEYETETETETESETDSETGSSNASSPDSSLIRSSSSPSFTPITAANANLFSFVAPKNSPLATSNVFPFTASSNSAATPKILSSSTSTSNSNVPRFATSNVPPSAKPILPPSSIPTLSPAAASFVPVASTSTSNIPSTASSNVPPVSSDAANAAHDAEQIRASFRLACEEINRELDIIMQPMKTKQNTLKAIEDYLVVLSRKAKQPFKIDLTDDSYTTKVSLKIDKNKVTVFSHTSNQGGEADSQDSEGAVGGPSRVVQGGGYWLPPVNPFTSSVTLRQHLEAASNNSRPRRMRAPPGFHPTPQYNAAASSVEEQSLGAGMVRPPPGFHGIAAVGATISPGNTPGPNSVQGFYGLLDTQAIITDLYRQSLSVVSQGAVLATPQTSANNLLAATSSPEQLLYAMIARESQGFEPPTTTPSQFGYGQSSVASVDPGNDLWQHYANAAANSGTYIGEAGYWDDFLQNEVYDILTSDQNSDLWRQFEEYQRIQYAPGSLRTGSTIFYSDNTGPSKHGPIGHCRPRPPPQARCRPIENISIQRNFEATSSTNLGATGGQSASQDVMTLSDRFKNVSVSNRSNIKPRAGEGPQNRNAWLGALLLKRLKERAASVFPETYTINVPAATTATTATTAASTANASTSNQGRSDINMNNTISNSLINIEEEQLPCTYCTQNNRAARCPTHVLRDSQGRTVCPILRSKPCPICNKAGDNAHSVHDCPIRKQWDMDGDKGAKK